jgi:hypothetical protein
MKTFKDYKRILEYMELKEDIRTTRRMLFDGIFLVIYAFIFLVVVAL